MKVGSYEIADGIEWDPVAEYLYLGRSGEASETDEGHLIEYTPERDEVIGVTVVYPAQQLTREGGLFVTMPDGERVRLRDAEAYLNDRAIRSRS